MALINHIPFGLRIEDQQYVDVADVPKGRQCGCICPSCHIPLIARQGKANRWHFAHASRNIDESTKECAYSFFVSVRTMAKQLLELGMPVVLPEWRDALIEKRHGEVFIEEYQITRANEVELQNVQKEYAFEGNVVDIYGEIGGYAFVIYFTHPERSLPFGLEQPQQQRCGILEIRLDETLLLFSNKNTVGIKFIDELKKFIQFDTKAKNWVYHARRDEACRKAQESLDTKIANFRPSKRYSNQRRQYNNMQHSYSRRNHKCVICQHEWSSFDNEKRICPVCGSGHLYIRAL